MKAYFYFYEHKFIKNVNGKLGKIDKIRHVTFDLMSDVKKLDKS